MGTLCKESSFDVMNTSDKDSYENVAHRENLSSKNRAFRSRQFLDSSPNSSPIKNRMRPKKFILEGIIFSPKSDRKGDRASVSKKNEKSSWTHLVLPHNVDLAPTIVLLYFSDQSPL